MNTTPIGHRQFPLPPSQKLKKPKKAFPKHSLSPSISKILFPKQKPTSKMASTMATMAILNTKCTKPTLFTKPTIQTRPNTPLKLTTLPKGLISSTPTALAGAFFAALSSSEPALAAQQIADLADGGDNRGLALLLPIIPAIAWVLFNILQPALNQLNRMRAEKAVVAGLGLGALAWAATPSSDASEIAAVADAAAGDNRGTLILLVVLPAIGWVLFNILQPALNQLNRMRSE